ncbi:hypothetical protein PFISCL1PPCAC_25659, partial [Pristionchus fissidentatus]
MRPSILLILLFSITIPTGNCQDVDDGIEPRDTDQSDLTEERFLNKTGDDNIHFQGVAPLPMDRDLEPSNRTTLDAEAKKQEAISALIEAEANLVTIEEELKIAEDEVEHRGKALEDAEKSLESAKTDLDRLMGEEEKARKVYDTANVNFTEARQAFDESPERQEMLSAKNDRDSKNVTFEEIDKACNEVETAQEELGEQLKMLTEVEEPRLAEKLQRVENQSKTASERLNKLENDRATNQEPYLKAELKFEIESEIPGLLKEAEKRNETLKATDKRYWTAVRNKIRSGEITEDWGDYTVDEALDIWAQEALEDNKAYEELDAIDDDSPDTLKRTEEARIKKEHSQSINQSLSELSSLFNLGSEKVKYLKELKIQNFIGLELNFARVSLTHTETLLKSKNERLDRINLELEGYNPTELMTEYNVMKRNIEYAQKEIETANALKASINVEIEELKKRKQSIETKRAEQADDLSKKRQLRDEARQALDVAERTLSAREETANKFYEDNVRSIEKEKETAYDKHQRALLYTVSAKIEVDFAERAVSTAMEEKKKADEILAAKKQAKMDAERLVEEKKQIVENG